MVQSQNPDFGAYVRMCRVTIKTVCVVTATYLFKLSKIVLIEGLSRIFFVRNTNSGRVIPTIEVVERYLYRTIIVRT